MVLTELLPEVLGDLGAAAPWAEHTAPTLGRCGLADFGQAFGCPV